MIRLWPLYFLCRRAAGQHSDAVSRWTSLRLHLLHDDEPDLKEHLRQLLTFDVASKLTDFYEHVELSFSTFTDKPLPFLGYGNYGNFQTYSYTDHCFKLHIPVTADPTTAQDKLSSLLSPSPPSLSAPSAIFDALLRLLEAVPTISQASAAIKPLDIVVVTTSTWSHEPGDARLAIQKWNSNRHYSAGLGDLSWGGFGSDLFDGINLETAQDVADWSALANAFREADLKGMHSLIPAPLIEKFGPFPYPPVADSHIGPCNEREYPAWNAVREQLRSIDDLVVVFALAEPLTSKHLETKCKSLGLDSGKNCLVHIYEQYISLLDIGGAVITIEDPQSLSQTLVDTITSITRHDSNLWSHRVPNYTTVSTSRAQMRHQATSTKSALSASLAAAAGALVTSFIGGLMIWQKCIDDEEIYEEEVTTVAADNETRAPLSRAERAVLAFQGVPVDDFSSIEPLDSTPRTIESNLPDHFF